MVKAVRANTNNPLVIAGMKDYAYDTDSLIALDAKLNDSNVIYNYHPYMGQNQAGDTKKNADGFEAQVKQVQEATNKPVIVTEFGQFCCPTDGECFQYKGQYDGKNMGYDEAILSVAEKYGVSWTPWAWRPTASNYDAGKCQDINADGGDKLAHPTDGNGADWATLWTKYAQSPSP